MKRTTLRIFDGYAQLQPHGYADDPTLRHDHRAARTAGAAELRAIDGVDAAAPRVNGFAILANGSRSYGAAVVGVDPGQRSEHLVDRLDDPRRPLSVPPATATPRSWATSWRKNLGACGRRQGDAAGFGARRLGRGRCAQVVGIYHSGITDLDRSILEMPLARAQDTFAMGDRANTIALGGPVAELVNRGASRARSACPAARRIACSTGRRMEPAMSDTIKLKYTTSMLFYATLVVIVAFIILNTLLMSVLERTREFGMLLALGMRPRLVGRMVWLELITLALLGNAIGILVGGASPCGSCITASPIRAFRACSRRWACRIGFTRR